MKLADIFWPLPVHARAVDLFPFLRAPAARRAAPQEAQTAARKRRRKSSGPAKVSPRRRAGHRRCRSGQDIVIETDVLKAVVNTAGGVITKWELKQYRDANKEESASWCSGISSPARRRHQSRDRPGNVQLFTLYDRMNRQDLRCPLTIIR